ncbi:outer membrane beta-barrel protein [Hymenobacter sp. B1770]|uniref:outer membrane beta-barrel protein n=1 Tax=Hymenobacter sp. B1770 TaxID=1718788 RepID=UPI003CF03900
MGKLALLFLLLTGHLTFAQTYAIRGRVVEAPGQALPAASILLLQAADSAVVANTVTNELGRFVLGSVGTGAYLLKVSFVGYRAAFRTVAPPMEADTLDLGLITLTPVPVGLKEVTVTADVNPVTVKQDTVEYHAGAFAPRPNVDAAQLLARLPGVDVGADGNVRVQGESVTRIFVEGKEFFGGNLQMALKTLPADAIYKIQVIDGQSEAARFSGIDDGRREKIINLTLKADHKNSGFGKATAAAGTHGRYGAQGNYTRLRGETMRSASASSNNVNNRPLTGGTAPGATTDRARSASPGVATTHSAGLTAFEKLSPKTSVNGNYIGNYSIAQVRTNLLRQNFLPEGTAFYYQNSGQRTSTGLHNAIAGVEHRDSLRTVKLNASVTYASTDVLSTEARHSFGVGDTLENEGVRDARTRTGTGSLQAGAFLGQRFGRSDRLLTFSGEGQVNQDRTRGASTALTRFRQGPDEVQQQRNAQDGQDGSFSARMAYTQPLAPQQYVEAAYAVSNRSSRSALDVFDLLLDPNLPDPEQSTRFRLRFLFQQAGVTYRLKRGKLNFSAGALAQLSRLTGQAAAGGEGVDRRFANVLPALSANQQLSRSTRVAFNYSTAVREPTLAQLQPVVSRYDPLNQYLGNPSLRPEYLHQGKLTFTGARGTAGAFLSGSVNATVSANPITAAVTLDERQVRTTRYVNVAQSWSAAAVMSVSMPVKKLKSRFTLSPYLRQGQSATLLNGVVGRITQQSAGGDARYTYRLPQLVEVNLRAALTATSARYPTARPGNASFLNTSYSADATVQFLKKYAASTDASYQRFVNTGAGLAQAIPLLNASLSRLVLPDNRGEFTLSAHNLLDRRLGVSQTATINFLEQSTQNALGRFFLLGFTYNFKPARSIP